MTHIKNIAIMARYKGPKTFENIYKNSETTFSVKLCNIAYKLTRVSICDTVNSRLMTTEEYLKLKFISHG